MLKRVVCAGMLLSAGCTPGQVGFFDSFESGQSLGGPGNSWCLVPNDSSNAFANQPTYEDNVSIDRVPVASATNSVSAGAGALGGDFWKTPYPVNKQGDYWLGTFEDRHDNTIPWGRTRGDAAQGTTYSPTFKIKGSNPRYLTFLIGGSNDSTHEVVELVTLAPADPQYSSCLADRPQFDSGSCGGAAWQLVQIPDGPGVFRPAQETGTGDERMRRVRWDTSGNTNEIPVRLRISDTSASGHINFDALLQTATPPYDRVRDPQLWGYADLHTHWMAGLAFGAVKNNANTPDTDHAYFLDALKPYIWGQPYRPNFAHTAPDGTAAALGYQFAYAMSACDHSLHQGGVDGVNPGDAGMRYNPVMSYELLLTNWNEGSQGTGTGCNNAYTGLIQAGVIAIPFAGIPLWADRNATTGWPSSLQTDCSHDTFGATRNNFGNITDFQRSPYHPYLDLIHQQMYWEWVRRAWQGGLRLMVVDVLNSVAAEAAASNFTVVPHGTVNGGPANDGVFWTATDDVVSINRQTRAMKLLVKEPDIAAFVEIAYNPKQARDIINRGKLAIVLGTEVDGIGSLRGFSGSADAELDYLQSVGVRKVIPIHLVDNALGGGGIYNDLLVTASDFLNGGGNCFNSDMIGGAPDWMQTPAPQPGEVRCTGAWNGWIQNCGTPPPDNPQNSGLDLATCFTPKHWQAVESGCPSGTFGDGNCSNYVPFWTLLPSGSAFLPSGSTPLAVINPGSFARLVTDHPGITQVNTQDGFVTNVRSSESVLPNDYLSVLQGYDANPNSFSRYSVLTPPSGNYDRLGVRNAAGLSFAGAKYITSMMNHSMILDIEHMSEKSYQQVIGTTGTAGMIWSSSACSNTFADDACRMAAYPVIASHTGFRQLGFPLNWQGANNNDRTSTTGKAASERAKTPEDVKRILASGGIIGVGTGFGENNNPSDAYVIPNDCGGSVKTWAQSYYYLRERIQSLGLRTYSSDGADVPSGWGPGIALGTDMNGFAGQLGPAYLRPGDQFQKHQCPGRFNDFGRDGGNDPANVAWEAMNQNTRWMNGVAYDDSPTPHGQVGTPCAPGSEAWCNSVNVDRQPPLSRLVVTFDSNGNTNKNYDVNYDGLGNYGLLPDVLQAAVNSGDSSARNRAQVQSDLRDLFRSAEGFVEAWEQSIRVCQTRGGTRCLTNTDPSSDLPPDVASGNIADPWDP